MAMVSKEKNNIDRMKIPANLEENEKKRCTRVLDTG